MTGLLYMFSPHSPLHLQLSTSVTYFQALSSKPVSNQYTHVNTTQAPQPHYFHAPYKFCFKNITSTSYRFSFMQFLGKSKVKQNIKHHFSLTFVYPNCSHLIIYYIFCDYNSGIVTKSGPSLPSSMLMFHLVPSSLEQQKQTPNSFSCASFSHYLDLSAPLDQNLSASLRT